jgi:quercetin dioxygenase-like cupin family protein
MSNTPTSLEEVIHHNVTKNHKTGGPALDVGQMKLLWRALGENTGYTFSIFETTIVPGMGIPLHKHPFAEFFYVLEGTLAIGYWNNQGVTEWDTCEAGESLMVQPNAPHTFFNKSEHPCRVLSVSTYHHERMMKDAVHPEGRTDFLPAQLTQADFRKLTKSMEKNQTFLVADHA